MGWYPRLHKRWTQAECEHSSSCCFLTTFPAWAAPLFRSCCCEFPSKLPVYAGWVNSSSSFLKLKLSAVFSQHPKKEPTPHPEADWSHLRITKSEEVWVHRECWHPWEIRSPEKLAEGDTEWHPWKWFGGPLKTLPSDRTILLLDIYPKELKADSNTQIHWHSPW